MLRSMKPGDAVTVALAGTTHQFGPEQVSLTVVDTATRGGVRHRYASIIVRLGDEFPEDLTDHLARPREGL